MQFFPKIPASTKILLNASNFGMLTEERLGLLTGNQFWPSECRRFGSSIRGPRYRLRCAIIAEAKQRKSARHFRRTKKIEDPSFGRWSASHVSVLLTNINSRGIGTVSVSSSGQSMWHFVSFSTSSALGAFLRPSLFSGQSGTTCCSARSCGAPA